MNCDNIRRKLTNYLNGTLDAKTEETIEIHLKDCERCNQHLEELRNVDGHLRSLSTISASEDFLEKFSERLQVEMQSATIKKKNFFIPVSMIGVAASILIFIYIFYHQSVNTHNIPLTAETKFESVEESTQETPVIAKHSLEEVTKPVNSHPIASDGAEKGIQDKNDNPVELALFIDCELHLPESANNDKNQDIHFTKIVTTPSQVEYKYDPTGNQETKLLNPLEYLSEIYENFRSITNDNNATILSFESTPPPYAIVEVPIDNLEQLIIELEKIGVVKKILPPDLPSLTSLMIDKNKDTMITLRVIFDITK